MSTLAEKTIEQKSATERWHEWRLGHIGASEVGILMGSQAFKRGPIEIYLRLIGSPLAEVEDGPDLRMGHKLEPFAVALAETKLGIKIYRPADDDAKMAGFIFRHPDVPIGATLDGIADDKRIVEVKCPRPNTLKDMLEGAPLKSLYWWQCQAQLACCPDSPSAVLVIYDRVEDDVYCVPVARDEAAITNMLATVRAWWDAHVIPRVPPRPESPAEVETPTVTVAQDYTDVAGDSWDAIGAAFAEAKANLALWEAKKKEAEAAVMEAMRASDTWKIRTVSGHRLARVSNAGRDSIDKKLLAATCPELDLNLVTKHGAGYEYIGYYAPKGEKGKK